MTKKRKDQLESELATNFASTQTGVHHTVLRPYLTNVLDSYDLRSAANITYYVRENGDDGNTGLGSGADEALRQPQAALDKLPRNIDHATLIDIGAGDFEGFALEAFITGATSAGEGALTIQGTLAAPTFATGDATTSGTATGGSTTTLVDSGRTWTSDIAKGSLLLVGSEYRVIKSNTGTQINLASAFSSSTSGRGYSILEPTTNITTVDSIVGISSVYIAGCITTWRRNIVISNLNIQAPSAVDAGLYAFNTFGIQFKNSKISCAGSGVQGVVFQGLSGEYSIEDIYIEDDFNVAGVNLLGNNGRCTAVRGFADGLDGKGAAFQFCNRVDGVDFTASGCGCNGIGVYGCKSVIIRRAILESNSNNGLKVDNSWVQAANISGTSNTGYGASVLPMGFLEISGVPTVTGTTADATINEGTSGLTWASDFSTDSDVANNSNTNATILRRD